MSSKKDKNDRVASVSRSQGVDPTKVIEEIEKAEKAAAVKGVQRIGNVGNVSNVARITLGNKERLKALVSEETNRLARSGVIPESQRAVIEKAVNMVLEASIAEEDGKKR